MRWLLALALALACGCSKSTEPPPKPDQPPPAIPEAELKRAIDACDAYVAKVCKCAETEPKAKQPCDLAKGQPEAIAIAQRLAQNPRADREDSLQAADSIRKTTKSCIEQTAKLPDLGCL
jgi:hypothetical protein